MTPHAQIMDVALNRFLGTEANWCTKSYAENAQGIPTHIDDPNAVRRCAEGAVIAASRVLSTQHLVMSVFQGVSRVLDEQNPQFQEAIDKLGLGLATLSGNLVIFNDGIVHDTYAVPGVGYQGIRAAFEKYRAECVEKGV